MENASKALLMAGGILLVMLIVALIIFARTSITNYYNEQQSLIEISDITEFNLQFTNYDRNNVHGYELISLANKVSDYNKRYSTVSDSSNEKYSPITMKINMGNNVIELWYENTGSHMFNNETLTESQSTSQIVNKIENALGIELICGGVDTAAKLTKSIYTLDVTDSKAESYYNSHTANLKSKSDARKALEAIALDTYNSIVKDPDKKENSYDNMHSKLFSANFVNNKTTIKQYYEYYQFKRGIFKCDENSVKYNDDTGRIKEISFTFVRVE